MSAGDVKNIWIFNHYAATPDQAGGTRHYDLARELTKRGYRVVIFAAGFSHRLREELKVDPGQACKIEDVDGVKFVWIRTFPYRLNDWRRVLNMLTFAFRSRSAANKLPKMDGDISAPDIVIGSSVHLFAVAAARSTARRFGARFFMEVRDVWPQTLIDMKVMSKRHPFVIVMRLLEKRLYKQAEIVITPLPLASDYLQRHGVDEWRVCYLPQGTSSAAVFERPAPRGVGAFTAAYIGSFGPADGVETLVRSAAFIKEPGIKLLFVGDGEEKTRLINLATSLGLRNVEFREPVAKKSVPGLLRDVDACMTHFADIGVRFRYGMSLNKLIDYASAGKPIIFAGSVPNDMVAIGGCGISVPPNDPESVARAIKNLAAMEKGSLEKMGMRGKQYIAENHWLPALVDKLERVWAIDQASL